VRNQQTLIIFVVTWLIYAILLLTCAGLLFLLMFLCVIFGIIMSY